jgi:long-chain acyl-CoA synthetase
VSCEIRIVSDTGDEVKAGEIGELTIHGDNIMAGYLNQPTLTAEVTKNGWFHTGDFAKQDENGFVTITGRKKTVIITGGANVHPQEITDVLLGHENISEAVTFGLPDSSWGEVVASAIVPKPGQDNIVPADLIDYCRDNLASYKVPRTIKVFDALPRNPAGKIVIRTILDAIETDLAHSPVRSDATLDDKVLNIAARVFGCETSDLRLNSDANSTKGWDSLAHMNLMHAIEVAFGLHLSPREVFSVSRLEHLKALITKHSEKQSRTPK